MRPVFEAAATTARRIVFAEGEDERVLRAAQAILEETTETPILIGRPEVIEARAERADRQPRPRRAFAIVNPDNDPRYRDYWGTYHQLLARRGVTPDLARAVMRTNTTAIGAVMVHRTEADALICGTFGQYLWHLNYVRRLLGGGTLHPIGALSLMIMEDGPLFVADTQIHPIPTAEQIAETAIGAARRAAARPADDAAEAPPVFPGVLEPGRSAFARLHLEQPVALTRGDRFVLRAYSPVVTGPVGPVTTGAGRFRSTPTLYMLLARLELPSTSTATSASMSARTTVATGIGVRVAV